ncbi:zinc finger MYND domain-containing protein 15-like isoform X2 [Narcine bancroftii]|uniref:zinc finger MYND domain-containing protein 15-like isoform X2 n=1 Tax=Narcine bancroftii TaxID=1343680 RepID=UPI0038317ECC
MEFVSGYRDQLIDFSELLFHWYRKMVTDRAASGESGDAPDAWRQRLEAAAQSQPASSSIWSLHVIQNTRTALTVENPAQQMHDRFYNDDTLSTGDLAKYVSFINLEEEEELALQRDHFIHVDCLLFLIDAGGCSLGLDFTLSHGPSLTTSQLAMKAYDLLLQSIVFPMCGCKAQRPQYLHVRDEALQRIVEPLILNLGVKSGVESSQCPDPSKVAFRSITVKACHVCKKHSFETTLRACDKCQAVLYCSVACQRLDWSKTPEDSSHRYWCPTLKEIMSHEKQLADFPFTYTAEVTSPTFDREIFLIRNRLCSVYWLCESMLMSASRLYSQNTWVVDRVLAFLTDGTNPYYPLKEGALLVQELPAEPSSMKNPFVTWKSYYKWRGLSLDSPVAVLLTYSLTIYHIITRLVPQHFPELNILNKQSLKIHILEAKKQFDLRLVFWELAVLLPHITFEIHFVGDGLPLEIDEQQFNLQWKTSQVSVGTRTYGGEKIARPNIRIKVCAKPYHMKQGAKADLVVGFNAGFGLSETWLRSLPRLQSLRVPAYFTECCEYSCLIDNQTMSTAAGGSISKPLLNPFRSPFRIISIDNNLPWYCNSYIFHLVYKVNPVTSRLQPPCPPTPPVVPLAAPPVDVLDMTRRKRDKRRSNLRRRK